MVNFETETNEFIYSKVVIGVLVIIILLYLCIRFEKINGVDTNVICAENKSENQENYVTSVNLYDYNYPRYCSSCGNKNMAQCNDCIDCGVCKTPDGDVECVPGDIYGPYFREDCVDYEYGNMYPYYWDSDDWNYWNTTYYPNRDHYFTNREINHKKLPYNKMHSTIKNRRTMNNYNKSHPTSKSSSPNVHVKKPAYSSRK